MDHTLDTVMRIMSLFTAYELLTSRKETSDITRTSRVAIQHRSPSVTQTSLRQVCISG